MKKTDEMERSASGKSWLPKLKKVASVVSRTASMILTAPLQLPAKIVAAVKYLALLSGLVQAIDTDTQADE